MMVDLFRVSFLDFRPVHDLPEGLQVRGPAVLVIQVIRVLPNVKREERLEAVRDGVVRVGVLGDGELAI